jgi:ribonuclease VapC
LIVDSSVVVALLQEEPGCEELEQKMLEADALEIGAPTLVESLIVMGSAEGEDGLEAVSRWVTDFGVKIVPFGQPHSKLAAEAFLVFGKGRHRARLNYGDCMTYATARRAKRPLLFTGADFAQTDIQAA